MVWETANSKGPMEMGNIPNFINKESEDLYTELMAMLRILYNVSNLILWSVCNGWKFLHYWHIHSLLWMGCDCLWFVELTDILATTCRPEQIPQDQQYLSTDLRIGSRVIPVDLHRWNWTFLFPRILFLRDSWSLRSVGGRSVDLQ